LIEALRALYDDQDHTKLRFTRPSKFVFLCGGVITPSAPPSTLRDYLYRTKHLSTDLNADVVLAETARDLFRSTKYRDLISFEEDIARLASLVIVIPESPGSLAELGAFATNEIIQQTLCVIVQERFANDESFIRLGPIEHIIKTQGRDFVGVYPWRIDSSRSRVLPRSMSQHYADLVQFINIHLDRLPSSTSFRRIPALQIFYVIYWVANMLVAVSSSVLKACVSFLLSDAQPDDISNKIYSLMIAGWLKQYSYSHKDYYYATVDSDLFNYSYRAGIHERDSLRRKSDIRGQMKAVEQVPPFVLSKAVGDRRPPPK
jgi:hypothetical protein